MACFSWAYVRLSAGAGALVIAVAVQAGMLVAGLRLGQHPGKAQSLGIGLAMAGLVYLLRSFSALACAGRPIQFTAGGAAMPLRPRLAILSAVCRWL